MIKCKTHPTYMCKKEPKNCHTCYIMWLKKRLDIAEAYIQHITKYGGAYVGF